MSYPNQYIQAILAKHNINVTNGQTALFEAFVQEPEILEALGTIKNKQTLIMEKWREKALIDDILNKHIVLPNGRSGKEYTFLFDFEKLGLEGIGSHSIAFDETTGMRFDPETRLFTGTPTRAGEFEISLFFKLDTNDQAEALETTTNSEDSKPFHEKKMKLIVNPDPKSLWKDLESDHDDPYWKPDNISASLEFGERKLVIGSKRGRSHAHEGRFRDDAFEYVWLEASGWGIVAIADGAGSAKYSRKGSEIACAASVAYFKSQPEKLGEIGNAINDFVVENSEDAQKILSGLLVEHLGAAAFSAQTKIREEAEHKSAEMRDYSTTLIFSLFKKLDSGYAIASFWVGDGGIGIYDQANNEVAVLGTPDSGEFAGQTRFLTMSDIFANGAYASRIKFKIVKDFTALVLMTDGVTDPKFQTDANLGRIEIWNDLWADLAGKNDDNAAVDFTQPIENVEINLMKWMDFWSPGNHDDRTIAILY